MNSGEFRAPDGERWRFAWSDTVAFAVIPAAGDPAAPTVVRGFLLWGRTLVQLDVVASGPPSAGKPPVTVSDVAGLLHTAAVLAG